MNRIGRLKNGYRLSNATGTADVGKKATSRSRRAAIRRSPSLKSRAADFRTSSKGIPMSRKGTWTRSSTAQLNARGRMRERGAKGKGEIGLGWAIVDNIRKRGECG